MEATSKWVDLSMLQEALKRASDEREDAALQDIRQAVDAIMCRGSIETTETDLTKNGTAAFFQCIVQAHAVRVFKAKTIACGPLARILNWFVRKVSASQACNVYDILLRQREYDDSKLSVREVTAKKGVKVKKPLSETSGSSAEILLGMLTVRDVLGDDIDAVLSLLEHIVCDAPGSSDKTHGTNKNGPQIVEDILASQELLSLVFDPAIDSSHEEETPLDETSEVTLDGDEVDVLQEGRPDTSKRAQKILLAAITARTSEEAFDTFVSHLIAVYQPSIPFIKTQLNGILETILSGTKVDIATLFLDGLCIGASDNNILLFHTIEFLFLSPLVHFTMSDVLFERICDLFSFCAENRVSAAYPCFLDFCCQCVLNPDIIDEKPIEWICERLHFLSLFFAEESEFVQVSDLDKTFVESLFCLYLTLRDNLASIDAEDFPFTVSSDFKTISNYCHRKAPFSVFSCLLRVSHLNSHVFAVLSEEDCLARWLHKWCRNLEADDVTRLFNLCENMKNDNNAPLLMSLDVLLQSDDGRDAVRSIEKGSVNWPAVCEALLCPSPGNTVVSSDALLAVIRLTSAVDRKESHYPIAALMSKMDQMLLCDIPSEDFKAFVNVLADKAVHQLNEWLTIAHDTAVEMESLKDVKLFDWLVQYVIDVPESKDDPLSTSLTSMLVKFFELLERNDANSALEKVKELVCLLIDGRFQSQNKEKPAQSSDDMTTVPAFFSAQFPQGKNIMSESTPLADLQRMVKTFGQSDLSLKSSHLRRTVLQTHEVPCSREKDVEPICSMILTPTTEENIARIEEVVADGNPVLLIGSTGVGKTATLTEVCRRKNVEFVRINMSSNLTPEDFLAKVAINREGETVQKLQPFAESFKKGFWVLLDEMNLAEEGALKVVIDAVESGQIAISDRSSALSPTEIIPRHPNFRLFASQNRWQAGKRERISDAFLSHFSLMDFKELPKEEWRMIVEQKMNGGIEDDDDADLVYKLSRLMTDFHWDLKEELKSCPEQGSYATVTYRELLMWTDMVLADESLAHGEGKLGEHAWLIYGCRFRGDGRQLVQNAIDRHKLTNPSGDAHLERLFEKYSKIKSPCRASDILLVSQFWQRHFPFHPFPNEDAMEAFEVCANAHIAVLKMIQSPEFMKTFGIYSTFSESWLAKWLADGMKQNMFQTNTLTALGRIGAEGYCMRFRLKEAREIVLDIFMNTFGGDLGSISCPTFSVPEMPIALDNHMSENLDAIVEAIRIEQSILISGNAGSGKTCIGKAVAFLLGNHYEHITLTRESEPAMMLGEYLPGDIAGAQRTVVWRDGPLTRAFMDGSVCIVDNIGQAEAVLQERMNPVLESPKVLCLTEKGDRRPLHYRVLADGSTMPGPARGFQVVATFTPKGIASRGQDSASSELTAALFNRFVIVNIDDPAKMPVEEFVSALKSMLRCCLPLDRFETAAATICTYCLKIREFLEESSQMLLSFRDFVTLIDMTTMLMDQMSGLEDQIALHCAMMATFGAQIRDPQKRDSLCCKMECPSNVLDELGLLGAFTPDADLVLTSSRKRHAQALLLGALTNKAVLLEGKPAVGKTALVFGLRRFAGAVNRVRLLSNSDTTTVQDYFGSWMPANDGFVFQKGILVQAMEEGHWFISDEFNLAPVAVTSALMPFLEGNCTVQIPGSNMRLSVHPNFRFFATQNPSRGGRDGRKLLPITVRNRFLTVDIEDFPQDELMEILSKRFRVERYAGLDGQLDVEGLATLYHLSPAEGFQLTMRDIIKIVRRYKLLKDEGQKVTWVSVAMSLLDPQAITEEETAKLLRLVESSFGASGVIEEEALAKKNIKEERDGVSFFRGHLHVHFPGFKLDNSPLWRDSRSRQGPPVVFQHKLIDLAFALKANEPVLLLGESAFKTELIKTWLELSGMTGRVQRVHLTSQSEATDLIGQVQLVSFVDVLSSLASTGDFILSYLKTELATRPRSLKTVTNSTYLDRLRRSLYRRVLRFKCKLHGEEFDPGNENLSDSIGTDAQDEQSTSDGEYENEYPEFSFEGSSDGSISEEIDVDNGGGSENSKTHEEQQGAQGSTSTRPDDRDEHLDSPREDSAGLTEDDNLVLIDDIISKIPGLVDHMMGENIPAAVQRMVHRLKQLRLFIRSADAKNSKPCFMFRDGPFVKAITMEHAFVVEDYDLCAQAVTERLNSALEVDPTFSIPEDVSFSDSIAAEMEIPKKDYCFIATSHLDSANKKPQLSAATQSRLTQIRVPVYQTPDIMSIAEEKLRHDLHATETGSLPYLMNQLKDIRSETVGVHPEHPCEDFRRILRWITFVTEHPRNLSIQKRCMLGAKFFYLAGYPTDIQNEVLQKFFPGEFEELKRDCALPVGDNPFAVEEIGDQDGRVVSLRGIGLSLNMMSAAEPSEESEMPDLFLCPTASVIENMARVFASVCTNSPLLLEGAPGIGKRVACVSVVDVCVYQVKPLSLLKLLSLLGRTSSASTARVTPPSSSCMGLSCHSMSITEENSNGEMVHC